MIINQPSFGCWRYFFLFCIFVSVACDYRTYRSFYVVSALLANARNVSVGVLAHYHPPEALVVLLLLLFPFNKNGWLCSMIG